MFKGIGRDLVYGGRSLAKARAFTFVCVVSLGIGMAPVIAIPYGARILRMPPPGVNTKGLVELVTTPRGSRGARADWSYPDFVNLRDAAAGIALIGWVKGASKVTLQTPGEAKTESPTLFVSANYFTVIGVALARGPGFDVKVDDAVTAKPVVILGYNFWQNRLGSDPDIVGKTLTLDGTPHVVVGIAPDQFEGHLGFQGGELFVPLERHPRLRAGNNADNNVRSDRGNEWVHIHGRLSPGVGMAQAIAAVSAVTSQLARQYPATNEFKAGIVEPYYAGGSLERSQFGMRQGERPDELVQHVKLPPHLAENPYLQEFYGGVEWTVRAIYADRVSWFDGNAANLFPLPERDRAAKLVRLIGGPDQVVARAHDALAAGEFKWAAELADYMLANDSANAGAKRIKAQALIELGERQINAIARNYYLSSAMYLLRDLPPQ